MFLLTNIRGGDELQQNRGESFLLTHPDPGVRIRPKEQLDLAMSTGRGLLGSRDGQVCAISLVYQFDPGQGPVSYEVGTMRVSAEGYGLQVFLASLHLVQIWLEDDEERGDVFAVVTPGSGSAHNLVDKVGMAIWTPPPTLALMRTAAGLPFSAGKDVLLADDAAFARAFAALRNWHLADNEFTTPKGGERLTLDLGWFNPALLDLGP